MLVKQCASSLASPACRQDEAAEKAATAQPEPPVKLSAQEEVLHTLLSNSRRSIMQLERQQELLKVMLQREQQQFDRLHFCLKKAHSDSAYIRVLEQHQS
ncbi:hypothetical protein WJX73_009918 [Symbiochloris irregularis]|uniref:Uncharacterized protein n=1 Tax=Symbiochloris irregularis TaxID=706552 RepID=A0AAW1NTG7_9CHLO